MKYPRLGMTVLAISLVVPVTASADSWSCRLGDDVREVHVQRPANAEVPCEVLYRKLTEGVEDQVLWNAQNDGSYCDARAAEFVEKLVSWGWTCVETISDETATQ